MSELTVRYQFKFRDHVYNGTLDVDSDDWADMDDAERQDELESAATDDFQDSISIVPGSINDEG